MRMHVVTYIIATWWGETGDWKLCLWL